MAALITGPCISRGAGRGRRFRSCWALALALSVLPAMWVRAEGVEEPKMKVLYLFNFIKASEWPEEAFPEGESPLLVCLLGKDSLGGALDALSGQTVRGRRIEVRRFKKVEDLEPCHVLFVSESERGRIPDVLEKLDDWSVLTVGDMKDFARSGGMINFLREGKKLRFEVNVDAAEEVGIKFSLSFLKLAEIVKGEPRAGKS